MVIQGAIDNLKDKPHDEKKAVAGGIAVAVVVVLLFIWAFMFLRSIQNGSAIPTLQGGTVPEDQQNAQFIQATQQQLQEYYQSSSDQYRNLREQGGGASTVNSGTQVSPNETQSEFGAQNNDF